jgi:transcriptional regulator with XRE-family HTH domain
MLVNTSPMLPASRTIVFMPKSTQSPATEFARRLIAARTARGLTQVQLAELTRSTQRNISYYETGAGYPPATAIAELANILRCRPTNCWDCATADRRRPRRSRKTRNCGDCGRSSSRSRACPTRTNAPSYDSLTHWPGHREPWRRLKKKPLAYN